MEARSKWDAWSALGDMTAADAEKAYVDELTKITAGSKTHKFVAQ